MNIHAHLLIGTSIETSSLPEHLKRETADVFHLSGSKLGIDDARRLVEQSSSRGFTGERHFIIATSSITEEAQNALLKLFEEPPAGAVFHLIVPTISILLPTLRSRLIETSDREQGKISTIAADFLKLSYGERLEHIANLAKKDSEALKQLVLEVVQSVDTPESKHSALLVSKYIGSSGASRKMLAEELALSLPV